MEISRLISVERISERLPSEEAKGGAKSKKKEASESRGNGQESVKKAGAREYALPINFEYLPSGKIQLNREAREQIIDFFE